MQQGAKVVLGLLAIGGVVALVMASGEKQASASPGQAPPILPPLQPPLAGSAPIPPNGGIVVVPPLPEVPVPAGSSEPGPNAPPPVVAPPLPSTLPSLPTTLPTLPQMQLPSPFPSVPAPSTPAAPTGTTITLPGIGTYNPATGNVFGPTGTIVGTFDPSSGVFTATNGTRVQVPGFGSGGGVVTQPSTSTPALPSLPSLPSVPPASSSSSPGAEAPTNAPADTLQVVTSMLDQELTPHWRIASPGLQAWQKSRGLTADGSFGPGTALAMAKEIGTLPIVRGWPKGSFPTGHWLPDYQTALRQLAQTAAEPRRSQLLAAANREQGQGFGTPEKPIVNTITLHEV